MAIGLVLVFLTAQLVPFGPVATGATFSTNVRVNDVTTYHQVNASVAVGSDGSIHVVWEDYRAGHHDSDIYYAKSTDGGNTFGSSVRVTDNLGVGSKQKFPSVAISENFWIHVVWTDMRDIGLLLDDRIYYSRSENGGLTFSTNEVISEGTWDWDEYIEFVGPQLVYDGSAGCALHVVWSSFDVAIAKNPDYGVWYDKSTDCGDNWGTDSKLASCARDASVSAASNGAIGVTYIGMNMAYTDPVAVLYTMNEGSGWSTPAQVDDIPISKWFMDPSVAIESELLGQPPIYGYRIHVAWADGRHIDLEDPDTLYDWDIYYAFSSDGVSFGPNVRVNDNPEWDETDQREPWISQNATFDPKVAWTDWRNDPDGYRNPAGPPHNVDVYFAESSNQGGSFDANQRVNDDSDPGGLLEQLRPNLFSLVADPGDLQGMYVVWQDQRDAPTNEFDVYSTGDGVPVLDWCGISGWIDDGVDPDSGDTSTEFVYCVLYRSPVGSQPATGSPLLQIWKGGQLVKEVTMTFDSNAGSPNNWLQGARYKHPEVLGVLGTDYSYTFLATDVSGRDAAPLNGDGPDVYFASNPPVLEWCGLSGWTSDGVNPDAGEDTQTFTYCITYRDPDGDPPENDKVNLHIYKGGSGYGQTDYEMTPYPNDPDSWVGMPNSYQDGRRYGYSIVLEEGDDFSYKFTAKDVHGVPAPDKGPLLGPKVFVPVNDWTVKYLAPTPRDSHSMAYVDSPHNALVIFGGRQAQAPWLDDTWIFWLDTETWEEVQYQPDPTKPPDPHPSARIFPAMAYDSLHETVVLFGGRDSTALGLADTWLFSVATKKWEEVTQFGTWPERRDKHAMVYDEEHEQILLFGGMSDYNTCGLWPLLYGPWCHDAWLFDVGTLQWSFENEGNELSGRAQHAMVYDVEYGITIVRGGLVDYTNILDDMWYYDLDDHSWHIILQDPFNEPTERYAHSMAYDEANQRTIFHGGVEDSGIRGDTWAYDYDTGDWEELSFGPYPNLRRSHTMAYSSVETLTFMFGGGKYPHTYDDVWALSYSTKLWTHVPAMPIARYNHAMTYDSTYEKTILFGGSRLFGGYGVGVKYFNDLWTYDMSSGSWSHIAPTGPLPVARAQHAMTYDEKNEVTVMFGGHVGVLDQEPSSETWVYHYSGSYWEKMSTQVPPDGPDARYGMAIAYDKKHEAVLMYGGTDGTQFFTETWSYVYDTDTWTNLLAANPPPEMKGHSMSYDDQYETSVLYGGADASQYLGDIWIYHWNTNEWEKRDSWAAMPEERAYHAHAYDIENCRIVLFAGLDGTTVYGDTWSYDAHQDEWAPMNPSLSPAERYGHSVVYDSDAGVLVLFSGEDAHWSLRTDVWVYQFA